MADHGMICSSRRHIKRLFTSCVGNQELPLVVGVLQSVEVEGNQIVVK